MDRTTAASALDAIHAEWLRPSRPIGIVNRQRARVFHGEQFFSAAHVVDCCRLAGEVE